MALIIGLILLGVVEIVGFIIIAVVVIERTAAMQEELTDIRDAVQPPARTAGKIVPVPTPRGIRWQPRPGPIPTPFGENRGDGDDVT